MIRSEDAVLIQCGLQDTAGTLRLNGSSGQEEYLLLMFKENGSVSIQGEVCAVQPFTYVVHPFVSGKITVSVHRAAEFCWLHLQLSDALVQEMRAHGLQLQVLHTAARPLELAAVRRILFEHAAASVRSDLCFHALGLLLCLLMQEAKESMAKAASIPHFDRLSALRREIYQNPANDWFIQDICERLCLSRPYFHKIYQSAFGVTCTQDVIASRIAYAKTLLETTEDAVSVISQRCGFETDAYFMRQFKRHAGMTPTVYRRVFRQSRIDPDAADSSAG